jgi:hypothetical protein
MSQTPETKGKLRRIVIPVLAIAIVIFISVCLYAFGRDPERVNVLKNYGYLGDFLISLIGNASILLPGVALSALTVERTLGFFALLRMTNRMRLPSFTM